MMKKVLFILCLFLAIGCLSVLATQNEGMQVLFPFQAKILLNGEKVNFKNPVFIYEDKTYVPLREVSQVLGVDISWDEKTQTVQINYNEKENGEDWVVYCEEGAYGVQYGYMDRWGNIKIEAQYDVALAFTDGVAIVGRKVKNANALPAGEIAERYGVINSDGKELTPIKYTSITGFSSGMAWVTEEDGTSYYIDTYGNRSSQIYIGNVFFTEGYAPMYISGPAYPMPDAPKEEWSYIDSAGERVTEEVYEAAGAFENGMAVVKKDGKCGIINTEFTFLVDCKYEDIQQIGENRFAAKESGKWGIITSADEVIVPFAYFHIGHFSCGYAPVRRAIDEGAYVDINGNLYLDGRFGMVYGFIDGYACVEDKKTQKFGVIDAYGEYVIEPQYDSLSPDENGLVRIYHHKIGYTTYDYMRIDTAEILAPTKEDV